MQVEKQFGNLTVVIEGKATVQLVSMISWEYPSEYETTWVDFPIIVDVHNNYYDVSLTEEEEIEILESLDINDFVC